MRIFITGANGQLARSFIEEYTGTDPLFLATRDILDVSNRAEVLQKIRDFKPDIVFHFASLTRGDENAKDPERAKEINVTGTKHVVEACIANNAAILFVSTNEVFDGKKQTPYTEQDTPRPITTVGKMKYEAEKIIVSNMKKYYIVRTMWLYSPWSRNFIHNVLAKARKDHEVSVVSDEIGSPTSSSDVARAIEALVKTDKYGIYHLINQGVASRLDFAQKTIELSRLSGVTIRPTTLSEFKRVSKPPLYSALANTKAVKLGIQLAPWEDALQRFLKETKMIEEEK